MSFQAAAGIWATRFVSTDIFADTTPAKAVAFAKAMLPAIGPPELYPPITTFLGAMLKAVRTSDRAASTDAVSVSASQHPALGSLGVITM